LWVFGDNVEDSLGHIKFLIFYLLCAAAGAFLHGLILPDSQAPLIGASGAIAGIVAAYLILHPRVKIWVLVFMRIPLRIPAWIPLILWVGFQFMMLFVQTEDAISWPAHVGGIIAGAVLVLFFRRHGIALLDRNLEVGTSRPVPTIAAKEPIEPDKPITKWGRPS
jgi:membrane associated rhomboid family serine protease